MPISDFLTLTLNLFISLADSIPKLILTSASYFYTE